MKLIVFLLLATFIISGEMCQSIYRRKRGGQFRRIRRLVTNRDNTCTKPARKANHANLTVLANDKGHELDSNLIDVLLTNRSTSHLDNNQYKHDLKRSAVSRDNLILLDTKHQQNIAKICVLNLQSACNKVDAISEYILDNNCDVAFLTETWVSEDNHFTCQQFTPQGYSTHHVPRIGRAGGGVGIVIRNTIKTTAIDSDTFNSFEYAAVRVKSDSEYITLIAIYRPPGFITSEFLNDFSLFLEHYSLRKDRILMCGDFNVHVNDKDSAAVSKFCDQLSAFELKQHVHVPTHTSGHTLDLVITRYDDPLITSPVAIELFSDHLAVRFDYILKQNDQKTQNITYRKLKQINIDSFREDLSDLKHLIACEKDIDSLVNGYNVILRSALDKHAPSVSRRIKTLTVKPWFDDEVYSERNTRKKLERAWLKDKSDNKLQMYKSQKNFVNRITDKKKISFFNESITDKEGDQKALYKLVKTLTNKPTTATYPEALSDEDLANQFAMFFKSKIENINASLQSNPTIELPQIPSQMCTSQFDAFPVLTVEEVQKYILASPSKSCSLDPVPTFLLKQCLDDVSPVITDIVNKSLATGQMPEPLKEALITPIPKKSKSAEFKDFRPISNLPFISKLIERVVVDKLSTYCSTNSLNEKYQSAYRKSHSCETALLQVSNAILTNMDHQKVTILTLLDLSAAFDTIPHQNFLKRLECEYGITKTALAWFESYFSGRFQAVQLNDAISSKQPLDTGMPQGSGAGPWGYTRYTGPLGSLLRILSLLYHMFADDTQVHESFSASSVDSQLNAKRKIESCLQNVAAWMTENRLKLNSDKTEILIIGTRQQLSKMTYESINVCGEDIKSSSYIRNLGVYLDPEMKMTFHVQHIERVCFRNLRELRSIRRYLTMNATRTLVQAMVTSHLDYANGLLYGISNDLLYRLQKIQNAAARLVLNIRKYDHITHGLKKLHWLPVRYRIEFKIAVTTYKVLQTNQPEYLRELLAIKENKRSLRSCSKMLLKVPKSKLKHAGDRSFAVAAPTIWNQLPESIKFLATVDDFKRKLKTHMFKKAYRD